MLTWDTSNDVVKEGEDGGVVETNRLIQLLPVKNNVVILSSDRGCTVVITNFGVGAVRVLRCERSGRDQMAEVGSPEVPYCWEITAHQKVVGGLRESPGSVHFPGGVVLSSMCHVA